MEAFESELEVLLDMDEAAEYRDLMRQLVDVEKTRNDKLLSYTQFVLKSLEARTQGLASSLEADRISGLLAKTNNPALVDGVTYLTEYLASTKRGLLELLHLQRRSLIYTVTVPMQPPSKCTAIADRLHR